MIIYDNSAGIPEIDLWIEDGIVTVVPYVEPEPTIEERQEAVGDLINSSEALRLCLEWVEDQLKIERGTAMKEIKAKVV